MTNWRGRFTALLKCALAGAALVAPAHAQGPPPGGFGGPPSGQESRPGEPDQSPLVTGTVSFIDTNAGTITISTGNATRTINIDSTVHLTSETMLRVSDLKVGETVGVRGVPTGIAASQVVVGSPPAGLLRGSPQGSFGARGQTNTDSVSAAVPGGAAGRSFAMVTGTVKSLPTKTDPHLVLSLGPDAQVSLKIAEAAKIIRWGTVALEALKPGDRITVTGQNGADGTLTASAVGVNLPPDTWGGAGAALPAVR